MAMLRVLSRWSCDFSLKSHSQALKIEEGASSWASKTNFTQFHRTQPWKENQTKLANLEFAVWYIPILPHRQHVSQTTKKQRQCWSSARLTPSIQEAACCASSAHHNTNKIPSWSLLSLPLSHTTSRWSPSRLCSALPFSAWSPQNSCMLKSERWSRKSNHLREFPIFDLRFKIETFSIYHICKQITSQLKTRMKKTKETKLQLMSHQSHLTPSHISASRHNTYSTPLTQT